MLEVFKFIRSYVQRGLQGNRVGTGGWKGIATVRLERTWSEVGRSWTGLEACRCVDVGVMLPWCLKDRKSCAGDASESEKMGAGLGRGEVEQKKKRLQYEKLVRQTFSQSRVRNFHERKYRVRKEGAEERAEGGVGVRWGKDVAIVAKKEVEIDSLGGCASRVWPY